MQCRYSPKSVQLLLRGSRPAGSLESLDCTEKLNLLLLPVTVLQPLTNAQVFEVYDQNLLELSPLSKEKKLEFQKPTFNWGNPH